MGKQTSKGGKDESPKVTQIESPKDNARESRDIIRTWLMILAMIQTVFLAGVFGAGIFTLPTLVNAYKEADRIAKIGESMRDLRDSTQQMVLRVESASQDIAASKGTLEKKVRQFQIDIDALRASAIGQKKQIDSLMKIVGEYEPFMVKKP